MKPAASYTDLGGGLFCWSAYDPANKVDLSGSALRVDGKLILVDPTPLEPAALDALTAGATPAGIVLTNANHARAAGAFQRRYGAPVWMAAEAAAAAGLTPDEVIPAAGGSIVDGRLEAIPLPGAAAGEMALHSPQVGGALIVGDALIHLPTHGFGVLPDKYCIDPRALRRSLAGLLAWPFDALLFAHGEPILHGARKRLAALLGHAP